MDTRHTVRNEGVRRPNSDEETISSPRPVENQPLDSTAFQTLSNLAQQMFQLQQDAMERERRRDEKEERREEERLERETRLQLRMEEQERTRLEQQLQIAQQKLEHEDARDKKQARQKIAASMAHWLDSDQPASYLTKFEETMTRAKIPQEEWIDRLIPLLTGKAMQTYTAHVAPEAKSSYTSLKEAMMNAMGRSKEACVRAFWSYKRKPMEQYTDTIRELQWMAERMLESCTTAKEAVAAITTGKFLSMFNLEDADFVRCRKPTATLDYANLMEERMANKHQSDRQTRHWNGRNERQPHLQEERSWRREKTLPHQDERHWRQSQPHPSTRRENVSKPPSTPLTHRETEPERNNADGRPVVCYGCGQRGHKRPQCPTQIRRVTSPKPKKALYVEGTIGSSHCPRLLIDSGAAQTVVHSRHIQFEDLTGEKVRLTGFDSNAHEYPLAKVQLQVGLHSDIYEVAVSSTLDVDALLGLDLELLDYLLHLEKQG